MPDNSQVMDARALAARLRAALGRPLRVLHIGNIANNGYSNAKLQNRIGLDCDSLAYDYYHCMGCPEWEDADFGGQVDDQFKPDWTRLDLHGFVRPRWFAQGPRALCIEYLMARRERRFVLAELLWRQLAADNGTRAAASVTGLERRLHDLILTDWRVKAASLARRLHPAAMLRRWSRSACRRAARLVDRLVSFVARKLIAMRSHLPGAGLGLWRLLARAYHRYLVWRTPRPSGVVVEPVAPAAPAAPAADPLPEPTPPVDWRMAFIDSFAREFPQRADQLTPVDLVQYSDTIERWKQLFAHYDIIQGYSTDPLLPMLAGVPYTAMEHGTLRELPFQDSFTARLTALAYRKASHVFVTNSDCMDNARLLAGHNATLVNHPYDDRHADGIQGAPELRRELRRRAGADFLMFYPTRHDWVPGTGYADKANDVFIRAFGRLHRDGHRIGVVCCNWGRNVAESKALFAEYDCADRVIWVEPMGVIRLERTMLATEIVVDQFKLGAFGGVTAKALAAGVPVLTHLDPALFNDRMPIPPIVNCQSEDDIYRALSALLLNRDSLRQIAVASKDWVNRYHNVEDLLCLQLRTYAAALQIDLTTPARPSANVSATTASAGR